MKRIVKALFPSVKHWISFLSMIMFFIFFIEVSVAVEELESCCNKVNVFTLLAVLAFATLHFYIKWIEEG